MPETVTAVGPFPTAAEAAAAGLTGWNLRCNRCGGYGAHWLPGRRPGWGALALCRPHQEALVLEEIRHRRALEELTAVNFEQDRPTTRPA
jgi:hypothetical protein